MVPPLLRWRGQFFLAALTLVFSLKCKFQNSPFRGQPERRGCVPVPAPVTIRVLNRWAPRLFCPTFLWPFLDFPNYFYFFPISPPPDARLFSPLRPPPQGDCLLFFTPYPSLLTRLWNRSAGVQDLFFPSPLPSPLIGGCPPRPNSSCQCASLPLPPRGSSLGTLALLLRRSSRDVLLPSPSAFLIPLMFVHEVRHTKTSFDLKSKSPSLPAPPFVRPP